MKSACVRVPKKEAQAALEILRRAGCVRKGLKPRSEGEYLLIPVNECDGLTELAASRGWSLVEAEFEESQLGKTFKDFVKGRIPDDLLELIPSSYDIVGDIALIQLPEEALPYGAVVGEAIAKVSRNVKAVYAVGPVTGEFRVRPLRHVWGERRTRTVHKEYGVRICVDVARTYYNPSLSEEHRRIAEKVVSGEVIADLFCGVGPFTLHIVSTKARVRVYAVDINPHAIRCLLDSLELNRKKLLSEAVVTMGDARSFLECAREGFFDRVIMNYPHGAVGFLKDALPKVKVGGTLHVYVVATDKAEAVSNVLRNVGEGIPVEIIDVVRVIDYAPYKYIFRTDVVRKG